MTYDVELIQKTLIFNNLSAFEVKYIFDKCASLVNFSPGDILIQKGSVNDDLFFLPKGQVKIDLEFAHQSQRELNKIQGPIVLGEISYLDKSQRSVTVKAANTLSVYVINGKKLDELFKMMPQTGHRMKHNIALSVIKTIRKMTNLLAIEMESSQKLYHKAAELSANKYSENIANLAYKISLSV